jgi:hypothetical protein
MTTFGKILAVFCLLFSVGTGAQNVYLYIARVNYANVAKKWETRALLAEAGERAEKDENAKLTREKNALNQELQRASANVKPNDELKTKVDKLATELAVKDQEVKALAADADRLKASLIVEKKKSAEYDAIVKARQVEAEHSLKDKNQLKADKQALEKENTQLRDDKNKFREEKVKAEIERDAVKERNKQVEQQFQDVVKENARLTKAIQSGTAGVTGATTISLSAPNPPNFALDGKVLAVGDGGGLIQISVGSDAGLVKGHTLEVFRLGAKSQYLGMIRLISIEPNTAVGQVVGKAVLPIQRGDNVASKILGN